MKYNSAVKASGHDHAFADRRPFQPFTGNGITVFQHNVLDGVDGRMRQCDCLTTHIAWRNGYKAFTEGSIADGSVWADYIEALRRICRELAVPSFLVCGKECLSRLKPDRTYSILFKRCHYPNAVLAVFSCDEDLSFIGNEEELQAYLCQTYQCVCDPCCGFGTLAVDVLRYGRKAVMSDITAECLEYIQHQYCEARP